MSFKYFHPIALCNTVYKIFTKAIAVRLAKLLPLINSDEQGGFVPGKDTPKGSILAHEVIHSIMGDNSLAIVLKLDMKNPMIGLIGP